MDYVGHLLLAASPDPGSHRRSPLSQPTSRRPYSPLHFFPCKIKEDIFNGRSGLVQHADDAEPSRGVAFAAPAISHRILSLPVRRQRQSSPDPRKDHVRWFLSFLTSIDLSVGFSRTHLERFSMSIWVRATFVRRQVSLLVFTTSSELEMCSN